MAPARKIKKLVRKRPKRVDRVKTDADEVDPPQDTPVAVRPTQYTPELGERILERLASGTTATEICRDETMPTWPVLKRWERDHEDFAKRYEIARRQCCEYHTDEIITIADDATNDYVTRQTKAGPMQVFNRESFERSRLRVDSRKWTASKILRHVYGDKAEVDLRTPDGVNLRVEERNSLIDAIVKLVSPKSDGETKPSERTQERRER